jgi:hypothetical protein
MFLGPLPENAFVAAARDNIPTSRQRVTTASTRGSLTRGRGRGRSSNRGRATTRREDLVAEQGRTITGRGQGKKMQGNNTTCIVIIF